MSDARDPFPVTTAQIEWLKRVDAAREAYTPTLIQRIADNDMPPCFEITREAYVALAQLLVASMRQLDQVLRQRMH